MKLLGRLKEFALGDFGGSDVPRIVGFPLVVMLFVGGMPWFSMNARLAILGTTFVLMVVTCFVFHDGPGRWAVPVIFLCLAILSVVLGLAIYCGRH